MHIICQIARIINCVELKLYFYVFRVFSESAGPIVKQNQKQNQKIICDRQSPP